MHVLLFCYKTLKADWALHICILKTIIFTDILQRFVIYSSKQRDWGSNRKPSSILTNHVLSRSFCIQYID